MVLALWQIRERRHCRKSGYPPFGAMGLDKSILEANSDITHQEWTISMHSFSDLTHVSPVVFLYLLKECYIHGKCKALSKFRSLQQTVRQVLYNAPRPGPALFVARCLCVLPIFELHCEGFSHLIISALRHLLKTGTTQEDLLGAKSLAAQLFLNTVGGNGHDERVLIKILEVFDIRLENIEKVLCKLDVKNGNDLNTTKAFVEQYIYELIESQSYMTAVTLLERFSFRNSGKSFLFKMMENKEYRAAEKWADFMGRPMLCALVQQYSDRLLLESAYDVIKKHNLKNEFPKVYHMGKECLLKKLTEKGLWDIAEARTNNDKQLLEYLVYLAMEAGYLEKVEELCDRYSLMGFANVKDHQASFQHNRFLNPNELALEDIIWVDEVTGLHDAICQIERCKVVGIDCEWKPVYEKGKQPKVSIMQIASEKMVHIFDLIKLFQDVPDILDEYLTRIFHSSTILKLGYNFQCDVKQLAHSYGDLKCFTHYEMLLDIQNLFNDPRGGLSGLAKKILGAELNKTRRNSNWEQRPLTPNQLEYAALDAAVLIHIFSHVQGHSPPIGLSNEHTKIEWKSHIVRHMGKPRKYIKQSDAGADEPLN